MSAREQAALAALQEATAAVNVAARVIATEVQGRYQEGPCDVCGARAFHDYVVAVAAEDEARVVWLAARDAA